MSFGGFLRRLSFSQNEEDDPPVTAPESTASAGNNDKKQDDLVGSSIFAGTSKLIDSMNARTSGLATGISNRFDQLKRRASQEALSMIDKEDNANVAAPQSTPNADNPTVATNKTGTTNATSHDGIAAALHSEKTAPTAQDVGQGRGHLQRCSAPNTFSESIDDKAARTHSGTASPGRGKPRPPKPPPPRLPRQNTNPFGGSSGSVSHSGVPVNAGRPSDSSNAFLSRHNSVGSYNQPPPPAIPMAIGDLPLSQQTPGMGGVETSGDLRSECQKIVSGMGQLMRGEEDEEALPKAHKEFVRQFVDKVVHGISVSQDEKAKFGEFTQNPLCRSWFVQCVQCQNLNESKINEAVFYTLVQFFAVVLFECHEAKDFIPAKDLMILTFRIHAEDGLPDNKYNPTGKKLQSGGGQRNPLYLYTFLKDQPIWQSPLFWDAAFQHSVEQAKEKLLQMGQGSRVGSIPFQQLSAYMCHMKSFPIKKEFRQEFLARQTQFFGISSGEITSLSNGM